MAERSVADGRLEIPSHWPRWKLKCTAHRVNGQPCAQWSVMGMPTCKNHGSGGEKNRQIGQLRYLSWIIVGGPQKGVPVEAYCRVAMGAAFEMLFNKGLGTLDQKLKAAMWLTETLAQ